jgi:NAD(P)H dehydrogenase (quinone)
MSQVSEELSRLLGHPVVYINRTPDEQRAALLAEGLAPFVADLMIGLEQTFRESVLGETASTVEELTGEASRPLPEWLAENIGLFRGPAY